MIVKNLERDFVLEGTSQINLRKVFYMALSKATLEEYGHFSVFYRETLIHWRVCSSEG